MAFHNKRVLTIAGSDSGGGAGIQADLKTFAARGVYGMSVITAVTAQNTVAVSMVTAMSPALVRAQIDAVLSDIGVDAIKIGMLANAEIVNAVADGLTAWRGHGVFVPIVLDPVMISKSGAQLLSDDAVSLIAKRLFPIATLVTPNLPEAAALAILSEAMDGGRMNPSELADQLHRLGAPNVLIKGGHGQGPRLVDVLSVRSPSGSMITELSCDRRETLNTHGTGCTYSAAIAAELAKGHSLVEAVKRAHQYLQGAIGGGEHLGIGKGHGPLDHLWSQSNSD